MGKDTKSETVVKKNSTFSDIIKKTSSFFLLIIITAISIVVFVYALFAFVNAKEIGGGIGRKAGITAGKFTGSYEGITQGISKGAKEGKEEGLAAKDTEVDIGNKVKTIGNLEVLSASVVMHDLLEISDKYKTLLAFYGDLTFSVNLSEAEITINDDSYVVLLPMPEGKLTIDDKKSEQLDSYMKHSWTGSNEDGYTAAMNSIKELTLNAEKTVTNYDLLKESAKSSAEKQVAFLIQSATKDEVVVNVKFK